MWSTNSLLNIAFPTGVLDCWAVLQKVAREPELFSKHAKPKLGLVLGGSSAGGNLSALLAHKSREEGLEARGDWAVVECCVLATTEYVSGEV